MANEKKRTLKIPSISLSLTDNDVADLDFVRSFVERHTGLAGLSDQAIVYHALLQYVERVMLVDRRGAEEEKKMLAAEFVIEDEDEDVEEPKPNTAEHEQAIIEANRQRLGITPVVWTEKERRLIDES
jgi:hypothetical protein